MQYWNNIYDNFNPVAFEIFGFSLHWYGLMYAVALISALWLAKVVTKGDKSITEAVLDSYFIWVEIGVILGARLGYILFYANNKSYYFSNPLNIFNPFYNGEFVGIRGMSYHGAMIGFIIATYLFNQKYPKQNIWRLLDVVAICVPFGYIFGRVGNFLNKELIGNVTDLPIGIYVDGVLRHPSQLYEAFIEGLLIFAIIFLYKKSKRFDGELIALYGMLYAFGRGVAEVWRMPDVQLGYIYKNWLSMGQLLSVFMFFAFAGLYLYLAKRQKA